MNNVNQDQEAIFCKKVAPLREDIRAETIRELETLISDCSRSKISEYDLWTKADGKQEVKAYLRTLKLTIQDILVDLGFENLQYIWFEYQEVNGERRYGPANGAIWWQITGRQSAAR